MLYHPNQLEPYHVQTDACEYGIGGCLYQIDRVDGKKKFIAFYSRVLKGAEMRYTVTEKEALVAVASLKQWRIFILGRKIIVITDHQSLAFIWNCRLLSSRITRWILFMQEYDSEIRHCKGRENVIADVLSRYPVDSLGSAEYTD